MVQLYVPGARSSTLSVGFSANGPLLAPAHSMVERVPPTTCEVTDTSRSVNGVLWKGPAAASFQSPQLDSVVTVAVSDVGEALYPAGTVSVTV